MTKQFVADRADNGPYQGQWVVIDMKTGMLAVERPFGSRADAESEAKYLNEDAE